MWKTPKTREKPRLSEKISYEKNFTINNQTFLPNDQIFTINNQTFLPNDLNTPKHTFLSELKK